MQTPDGRFNGTGCFLIGCGPSLNQVDVRRLKELPTITFNHSYVAWDSWGFSPTYYACFDPVALEDAAEVLPRLIAGGAVRRFFLHPVGIDFGIQASARVTFIDPGKYGAFSTNLAALGDFGNVGATSVQVLAALGYRKVVLVGVDGRYTVRDEQENGPLVRVGPDPDHFTAEYLSGKRRCARPNLERILGGWPRLAEACRQYGIDVRNASPDSALDCFPAVGFDKALTWVGTA